MRHIDGGLRELSDGWLGRFFQAMHTDIRRSAADAYLAGLLDPDPRKSLRAIAERTDRIAYHRLHHFINSEASDDGPIWNELINYANRHPERWRGCLVIEEIFIPKRGDGSAGVAVQSIGPDGRRRNGQLVVSLAMVRSGYVTPIGMQLVRPTSLDGSSERHGPRGSAFGDEICSAKARVVIAEIKRLIRQDTRIESIFADASYFACEEFREYIKRLEISWVIRIANDKMIKIVEDVVAGKGSIDERPYEEITGSMLLDREIGLNGLPWYPSAYQDHPHLAANRVVYRGDLSCVEMRSKTKRSMQLVVEWHGDGRQVSYLTNVHVGLHVRGAIAEISNQWRSKRAHSKMLRSFGLAKFEGRSEVGLCRHLLMVSMAYIYNRHLESDDFWRRQSMQKQM